ncbi:MAG: DUF2029 domain-containing protein [Microbacteriaceae bacterium]|nr:DUF2029 domain-containing protein [Microbacteriaceae bacterium]
MPSLTPARTRLIIALVVMVLVASAALTGFSVGALPIFNDKTGRLEPLVVITVVLWALFALSLVLLRRVPARAVIAVVLFGSLAIGAAALAGPPNTSTDSARYAWDGIVQNAGVSPYRYVPADPALASLRPEWLFPAAINGKCPPAPFYPFTEPASGTGTGTSPTSTPPLCTAINRVTVPTIYPPTSELYFAAVRFFAGDTPGFWPLQLAGLVISLGITGILLLALRRRKLDPRWAALWGWSPLAATEAVTNSHVDVLGGLLVLVATLLVTTGRPWRGGIALGAAIAVKLIPVIAAPALLRRNPVAVIVGSIATFGLLYVPYVLSTGVKVIGYLPGYLSEEGYDNGTRFILLSLFAPGTAALVIAALLIALTAVLVWWKCHDPWLGLLIMIGVTLLIVTPRYPWYALLLGPIIAMTGRWEWLTVPLALTSRFLVPSLLLGRLAAAASIITILWLSWRRLQPDARARLTRAHLTRTRLIRTRLIRTRLIRKFGVITRLSPQRRRSGPNIDA